MTPESSSRKGVLGSHPVLVVTTALIAVAVAVAAGTFLGKRTNQTTPVVSDRTASSNTSVVAKGSALPKRGSSQASAATVRKVVCAAGGGQVDSQGDACAFLSIDVSPVNPRWILVKGIGYYQAGQKPSAATARSDLDEAIVHLPSTVIGPTNVGICGTYGLDVSVVPPAVLQGWGLTGCVTATTVTTSTPTTAPPSTTQPSPATTAAPSAGGNSVGSIAGSWYVGSGFEQVTIQSDGDFVFKGHEMGTSIDYQFSGSAHPTGAESAAGTITSSNASFATVGGVVAFTFEPSTTTLDVALPGNPVEPFCGTATADLALCGA